jgi:hypothetical protein
MRARLEGVPMNDTTHSDLTAELESMEGWVAPAVSPLEQLPPLVPEARWTSTSLAVPLIAASQAFYSEWTVLQGEAPYAIYHYTDAEGLSAILEGGRIWASDLLYLAGSRESDYVCEMVRQQITRRWNRADPLVNEFCEKAVVALDPSQWQRSIFAACFCENGDALGQWRAYAGPRGGYAVGLRTAALTGRYAITALRRVIYDSERQQGLIDGLIERAVLLLRSTQARGSDSVGLVLEFLADHVAELIACFKPPAFKDDHEWRMLLVADTAYPGEALSRVHFRHAGGHIVPYVEFDVSPRMGGDTSPIAEVICGPLERAELSARAIHLLLKKRAISGARVRASALSLR